MINNVLRRLNCKNHWGLAELHLKLDRTPTKSKILKQRFKETYPTIVTKSKDPASIHKMVSSVHLRDTDAYSLNISRHKKLRSKTTEMQHGSFRLVVRLKPKYLPVNYYVLIRKEATKTGLF